MAADKSASALRIRNNQRRSRANRKEYIASLEQRLSEYAARGTQATIEMQAAARAVAVENQRLRMLLASVGVSEEQVARHLESFRDRAIPTDVHVAVDNPGKSPTQRCDNADKRDVNSEDDVPVSLEAESGTRVEAPVSPDHVDRPTSVMSNNDSRPQVQAEHSPPKICGKTRLCSSNSSTSPTLETPCEMAASIILRMRGQDDESAVYSTFGCENGFPQGCTIKNTILFQLMDEM
ncbi:hypothetical protein ABW21_db0209702 [Orbilia brochopaga]|nr:hypothetical protein ABW21_db0209702 [Drechslerella brochopaga]